MHQYLRKRYDLNIMNVLRHKIKLSYILISKLCFSFSVWHSGNRFFFIWDHALWYFAIVYVYNFYWIFKPNMSHEFRFWLNITIAFSCLLDKYYIFIVNLITFINFWIKLKNCGSEFCYWLIRYWGISFCHRFLNHMNLAHSCFSLVKCRK